MRGVSLLPRCYMDDRGRNRCEEDDKVAYESQGEADRAAADRRAFTNGELRTYLGDCGWWHMTSNMNPA